MTNVEIKDDVETTIIKKDENNKEKIVRILTVVFSIFIIIALIIIKTQNPSFPFKWIVIIIMIVLIFGIIFFFSFSIYHKVFEDKKEEEEKLPNVATEEQLKQKVYEVINSVEYKNHIKKFLDIKQQIINGNLIYDFSIEPLYDDKKSKKNIIHVIINAHFINRIPTVLYDPSVVELKRAINLCSTNPTADADVEKTEMFNPLTNTVIKTSKKTHQMKKDKSSEKKEDLA